MESSWSYILPEFRLYPFVQFWLKKYSDTKIFSLSVYFILLKIGNCYGLILLNLKKNEKSIEINKVIPGNMG